MRAGSTSPGPAGGPPGIRRSRALCRCHVLDYRERGHWSVSAVKALIRRPTWSELTLGSPPRTSSPAAVHLLSAHPRDPVHPERDPTVRTAERIDRPQLPAPRTQGFRSRSPCRPVDPTCPTIFWIRAFGSLGDNRSSRQGDQRGRQNTTVGDICPVVTPDQVTLDPALAGLSVTGNGQRTPAAAPGRQPGRRQQLTPPAQAPEQGVFPVPTAGRHGPAALRSAAVPCRRERPATLSSCCGAADAGPPGRHLHQCSR